MSPQIRSQDGPPTTFMIALDFGTTKSAAAFRMAHSDGPPRRYDIIEAEQDIRREKTAPMIAAWLNDKFVCGHELQTLIYEGKVAEQEVMRFFKLLLYDDWQESESAQHAMRLLKEAGKSTQDLFTAVLSRMYFYAQEHILRRAKNKYDTSNIPRKVYLTVPKNASFSARQLLARSCERAGIPQCVLVSEPLCAAAYNLQSLADENMAAGLAGEHIIVLDGGGGTVDIATFTWNADPTEGARTKFEMIGDAHAALCGAEYVGDAFIEWFQTRCPRVMDRGGIRGTAENMWKSPTQLRAQARKEFEQVKRNFGPDSGDDEIYLIGGTSAQPVTICVTLLWTTIQTFFEEAVQKVLGLIDFHHTDRTKYIICKGGFGKSRYLQRRIKETYPELKLLEPNGDDCIDLRVVKRACMDPKVDVVEDRIQWLIKQDDGPGEDGWYISRPLWQLGYLRVDGPEARKFTASIVVTERTSERLIDSEPLIDKVTGQMFTDLEIQGKIEITLDAEQARRYKTFVREVDGKKTRFYEVWSTVVLRHNKVSLEAAVAFAAPEESPYRHDGRLKPNISIEAIQESSVQWTFPRSQTHEVWNHRYDPHVHDIVGSTVRQDDAVAHQNQRRRQFQHQQHHPQQPPFHTESVKTGHPSRNTESNPCSRFPPTPGPPTSLQRGENREHHQPPDANLSRRRSTRGCNKAVDVDIFPSKQRTAKKSRPNWWR
ncbi:hypothetical protein NU219Hw_g7696t1 [Hortaea werneckii]